MRVIYTMKKTLLLLVLFTTLGAKAETDCTEFKKLSDELLIIALYENDCINCYAAANNAYKQLKTQGNIIIVTNELPLRMRKKFIDEKIKDFQQSDSIVFNTDIYKCLNPYIGSALIKVIEGEIVYCKELKETTNADLQALLKQSAFGKIDLSGKVGSGQSKIRLINNHVHVFDDLQQMIYRLHGNTGIVIDSFSLKVLEDSALSLVRKNVNLSNDEKILNEREAQGIISNLGSITVTYPPYFFDSIVYVPVAVRVLKQRTFDSTARKVIMPTQYLVKLNYTGEILNIVSLPYEAPSQPGIFHLSRDGYFEKDTFYALCNTANNDSIILSYAINGERLQLIQVHAVKYPAHFVTKSNEGRRIGYSGFFTKIGGEIYYAFNVEPTLYSLKNTSSLTFDVPYKYTMEGSKPTFWVNRIDEINDKIVVVGGQFTKSTEYFVYAKDKQTLLSRGVLSARSVEVVHIDETFIYYADLMGEEVVLQKKKW